MTRNAKYRVVIEISTAGLMLLTLATAVARRPGRQAPDPEVYGTGPVVDMSVVLNLKTRKYHCPSCELIRGCGTDCVVLDVHEAVRRGGKPCELCGGTCTAGTSRR